ncbi:MAG: taurine ABC transporter permease [Rhodobacteraceae bacterium]|nr:MAG: taurine ABC transporter permease [Paracoccaceae bacterium]
MSAPSPLLRRAPGRKDRNAETNRRACATPEPETGMFHKPLTCCALAAAVATAALAAPASATNVNFMMDWAWQGPQAFALVARNSGCFADGGVNITLDRGFGSGRVPVELASGTYDMGVADINPSIKFRAENPDSDIIAVGILLTKSPLVAVVKADSGIETPQDLEGRTLAAPDFDAGRQLFPLFAEATGIDASTVNWISVTPELREPMLVQGQADGVTGFITSSVPSLARLGLAVEDQRVFRYADFGVELYSTAILTTRRFAEANPEAVRTVVGCLIEGFRQAEHDPEAAIEALAAHEPLTDKPVELGRWTMTLEEQVRIDEVRENGVSFVDMERLQRTIEGVERAYGLEPTLQADDLFTPEFLPPQEARMLL